MQTFLIYSILFISVVCLSYYAGAKNKRRCFVLAAILLSVIAGMRGDSVGIDTQQYIYYFNLIAQGKTQYVFGFEQSFIAICGFLLSLFCDTSFLLLIFALLTNILIFIRIWDFRKYISLPWAAVVYFGMFYFMTFNIMRQFVAVSIVFWASRYLLKRKYIVFLLSILVASLFHNSALLGVLFFCFEITAWKYLNSAQKKLLLFAMLCSPIAIYYIIKTAMKYQGYFSTAASSIGLMVLAKLILFLLVYLTARHFMTRNDNMELENHEKYMELMIREYYLIGLCLTTIGYFFTYMDRIGLYFGLFEIIYVGIIMKSKRVNVLIKTGLFALYGYMLITSMFGSGQGQGNYIFVWQ